MQFLAETKKKCIFDEDLVRKPLDEEYEREGNYLSLTVFIV